VKNRKKLPQFVYEDGTTWLDGLTIIVENEKSSHKDCKSILAM